MIGKIKGDDSWTYTYNYANRLTGVEKNSAALGEYVYDGEGRRIQVTESSTITTYIYAGLDVIYEENANSTATYIYGPTGRLAKRTTVSSETDIFYYHTDHLGSTRLVTDGSRNIVTTATYHPFGDIHSMEGSEDYLFTGKKKDETGLHYFGARYFDPEIGRFITRDSLVGRKTTPQTLNRYTYCLNNPLKFIDPDGHGEKLSYIKSNPNPVRVSFNIFLNGLAFAIVGFLTLLSIMTLLTIPVGVVLLLWIVPALLALVTDDEGSAWGEDIDNDGYFETIHESRLPDGGVIRTIIEEDGTMYVTEYNPQNEVTHKWMVVPSENEGEDPRIYVWDEKTKQWLPDQDKDGIPDN
jgi:RHS repeat-associated protein